MYFSSIFRQTDDNRLCDKHNENLLKIVLKKKTQFSNIRERESEREGKTTIQWKTSIWFETNSLWSRRCLINLSWFCFSPNFCLFIWFICFYVEFRFFSHFLLFSYVFLFVISFYVLDILVLTFVFFNGFAFVLCKFFLFPNNFIYLPLIRAFSNRRKLWPTLRKPIW